MKSSCSKQTGVIPSSRQVFTQAMPEAPAPITRILFDIANKEKEEEKEGRKEGRKVARKSRDRKSGSSPAARNLPLAFALEKN